MMGTLKIDSKEDLFTGLKNSSFNGKSSLDQNYSDDIFEDEEFDQERLNQEFMDFALKDPPYIFNKEKNLYSSKNNCYDIGLQLSNKGDIYQAILAFEAEVQKNPKNASAWKMLGKCHQECDDDSKAISALIESVKIDPQNLDSVLDLACSYTNELNKYKALNYLKTWIKTHPSYGVLFKDLKDENNYLNLQQQVIDMFVAASKKGTKDPEVFSALGVLYNIVDDNEKAIYSFKKALEFKPSDHSLWNKLGATLANGKKSEEAIECYRNALKYKPTYVRAWVNLGIAYSNIKKNEESVKYYLRALKMCPNSEHIWQYLGMSFYLMKRNDLVEKCKEKNPSIFDNEKF